MLQKFPSVGQLFIWKLPYQEYFFLRTHVTIYMWRGACIYILYVYIYGKLTSFCHTFSIHKNIFLRLKHYRKSYSMMQLFKPRDGHAQNYAVTMGSPLLQRGKVQRARTEGTDVAQEAAFQADWPFLGPEARKALWNSLLVTSRNGKLKLLILLQTWKGLHESGKVQLLGFAHWEQSLNESMHMSAPTPHLSRW